MIKRFKVKIIHFYKKNNPSRFLLHNNYANLLLKIQKNQISLALHYGFINLHLRIER